MLRQQTAHVVIQATDMWHGFDIGAQGTYKLPVRHVQREYAGFPPGGMMTNRLHRQVQHDFLLTGMRLPGQFCSVGPIREEGAGYGTGQVEDTPARALLIAHVINDNGNSGQAAVGDRMLRLVSSECGRLADCPNCKQ
jgi:hypothetical protein